MDDPLGAYFSFKMWREMEERRDLPQRGPERSSCKKNEFGAFVTTRCFRFVFRTGWLQDLSFLTKDMSWKYLLFMSER